jgi:hypothetical protein
MKTAEVAAGGACRVYRWSEHSAVTADSDYATGVGLGDYDYTTWCLICTAREAAFSPSKSRLLDRVKARGVCLRPVLSSLCLALTLSSPLTL